jgi:hypothetical protein
MAAKTDRKLTIQADGLEIDFSRKRIYHPEGKMIIGIDYNL